MKVRRTFELTDKEIVTIGNFKEFLNDLWLELDENNAGTKEMEEIFVAIDDKINELVSSIKYFEFNDD